MAQSRELPPRVSVESVQDWSRIKSNVSQAAMSALEARLAGNDKRRPAMTAHLQRLLESTYAMAEKNIRANGHNLDELTAAAEDEEAFDEVLDGQIWDLQAQRLASERDVALKRRQRPREIQSLVENMVLQHNAVAEEEQDETLAEGDIPEPNDGLSDELRATTAEMNKQTYSIAEGMQQNVVSQKERIERVRIVETELRPRKT